MVVICSSTIESVRQWIDGSPEYKLIIDDVAKKSGWSKWHLQRVFQEETGATLGDYLFSRRMQAARDMLVTGRSLIVVADLIGYVDQSSFNRAFKRKYGVTPRQYLKNHGPK